MAARSLAALAALALALLNLASLFAAGYQRGAEKRLDSPDIAAAVAASALAAKLTPWSSPRHALHGWALLEHGDADAARAEYREALRWGGADPLLWSEYAQALARLGDFGPELTGAIGKAAALAPESPAVQEALAQMGTTYWKHGTPEQRTLWLAAMRHELARARGAFLNRAMARGQAPAFCRGPAKALGEEKWCDSVAPALLGGCYELTADGPVACQGP